MKIKNILIMVLAMVVATSCSKEDEGGEAMQVPLTVNAVINNGNSTRVSGNSFENGDQIGVFDEYSTYINVPYTKGDNGWETETPYYFRGTKDESQFYAYYPYTPSETGILIIEADKEYMFANEGYRDAYNNSANFQFTRIVSKIYVTFIKGNGVSNDEISGITKFYISGLYKKVKFYAYEGLDYEDSVADYVEADVENGKGSRLIFPKIADETNGVYIIVKVGGINYKSKLPVESLEANTIYNYTVTVNKTGLSVVTDPSITDWDTVEKTFDEDGNEIVSSSDDTTGSGSGDSSGDSSSGDNSGSDSSSSGSGVETSTTASLYSLALSDGTFIALPDGSTDNISKLSAEQKSSVVGVVYYINTATTRADGSVGGLIVALNDLSSSCNWQESAVSTGVETGQTIGNGSTNTSRLKTYNETATYPCLPVKALADNNVSSEWFIPSVEELKELYKEVTNVNTILEALNGTKLQVSGSSACYWTSTESSAKQAYYVYFNNSGQEVAKDKNKSYYVRAVRAF